VTDVGIADLKQLKVRSLDLSSEQLTDEGVAHLAEMKELRSLYLSARGRVTEKGLVHLKKLTNLKRLWVTANAQVTDEGMKSLSELNKLE